jgi:hypothetical protein
MNHSRLGCGAELPGKPDTNSAIVAIAVGVAFRPVSFSTTPASTHTKAVRGKHDDRASTFATLTDGDRQEAESKVARQRSCEPISRQEALRKRPPSRYFAWSGRRDSNPRPSPWQGELTCSGNQAEPNDCLVRAGSLCTVRRRWAPLRASQSGTKVARRTLEQQQDIGGQTCPHVVEHHLGEVMQRSAGSTAPNERPCAASWRAANPVPRRARPPSALGRRRLVPNRR